ncbi:MAG TPA: hypothetical protein VJN94_01440 [Candidatus Binataceae bacterium]|nr:hypothetical protein [Candidatus Binataceae bacterium]
MKNFIAGVVLGVVASCGMVFASPGFGHNGVFWQQLTNPGKTGYIDGYRDAMGVSVQEVNTLSIAASYLHWKSGDKIIHQLIQELSMADTKPADAVRKLDLLYANPKYSELDLGQALQLLSARTAQNANESGSTGNHTDAPRSTIGR